MKDAERIFPSNKARSFPGKVCPPQFIQYVEIQIKRIKDNSKKEKECTELKNKLTPTVDLFIKQLLEAGVIE